MRHVPCVAPGLLLFAPLDVILSDRADETTILQPDCLYIAPDRMALTSRRGMEGALCARYGVPSFWLLDPDARVIEAFLLERDRYVLAVSVAGARAVDLPPFTGVGLIPDALWPAPLRDR